MRVVYDYGVSTTGTRTAPVSGPVGEAGREPVIIIRAGLAARTEGDLVAEQGDTGAPPPGGRVVDEEGLRIAMAGEDWLLTVSDEALQRERTVRLHEQAHAKTLGAYADSTVSYQTQRGPDGQQYVTGGSIRADLTEVPGDPRATLRKARTVMAAAHAVGDPSTADMRVAAEAYRMAREATSELREIARA